MIPKKEHWKEYSAIEKATYIAALCAVISVPLSIYFWYQSKSDAEETYQKNQELFTETNRPIIELEKIEIVEPLQRTDGQVRVYLKNTGNIAARNICIGIYEPFGRDGHLFSNNTLVSTCSDENTLPSFGLRKNGETSLPLLGLSEIQRRIGFIPSRVSIQRSQPYQNLFLLNLSYKDVAGTEFHDMFPIEFYEH